MSTVQIQKRQEREAAEGWQAMLGRYEAWLHRRVAKAMREVGLRPVPEEVVETVQEVYCRLLQGGTPRLRRLRRLQLKAVLTYLGRVVESAVYDQVRVAGAAKRGGWRLLRMGGRRTKFRVERVPDPSDNPERALLLSEGRELFLRRVQAWHDLGPADRNARVVWMAVVEGWPSRDIGRAMSLAPRTVDTLLHRIRRRFAEEGVVLRRK